MAIDRVLRLSQVPTPEYSAFAWRCAPNAASIALSANTLTKSTLDTEVSDEYGHGTLSGNDLTLIAGKYAFDLYLHIAFSRHGLYGIYNNDTSTFIISTATHGTGALINFSGEFKISSTTNLSIRAMGSYGSPDVIGHATDTPFTASSPLYDRVLLQLWKIG
jgi:hypothetical protein